MFIVDLTAAIGVERGTLDTGEPLDSTGGAQGTPEDFRGRSLDRGKSARGLLRTNGMMMIARRPCWTAARRPPMEW